MLESHMHAPNFIYQCCRAYRWCPPPPARQSHAQLDPSKSGNVIERGPFLGGVPRHRNWTRSIKASSFNLNAAHNGRWQRPVVGLDKWNDVFVRGFVCVCVCKLFISSNHVDGVTCRYFAHRRELRQLSLHCETIYQFRDVIRICTHITHLRSPGSTGINPIALQKSLVSSHYPSPHTCVLMCGFQPSDTHKKIYSHPCKNPRTLKENWFTKLPVDVAL